MTQVDVPMPAKNRTRKPAPKPQRRSPTRKAAARKASQRNAPARSREQVHAPKGKWVYAFGGGKAEGRAEMKNLLGGKGAGLAEMASLGLPVPPGFTITTDVCTYFYANRKTYPSDLEPQVNAALERLGKIVGKHFGDARDPLLVSVRSGARASMPGIEARAPERTETRSGASSSAKKRPVRSLSSASAETTWSLRSGG